VECDTLDNILETVKVDVIKMDIEGAEVFALKAATNTLKRIRKIVVEIHGDKSEDVKRLLRTYEFNLEIIDEKGEMSYIIGSK